ncbi:hypothetical protein B0H14DRAFT_2584314 [Mycena olivaceomarginata]|nr:hypothetical protein B0H14DRAFT_2584314 [Mycena olivaceomarginata]
MSPCGLAIYKQINSQASAILSDINDDNFDHAFDFLRSIIQGTADTDQTVTGAVVQCTTDFLAPAIILTRPKLMEKVSKHLDPDILAPNAVNAITGNDEEANRVL